MNILSVILLIWLCLAGGWACVFRAIEGRWPFRESAGDRAKSAAHSELDLAMDVVAASILDCPDEWERTDYRLTNRKRRISIWISNEEYGLGVNTTGNPAWPNESVASKNDIAISDKARKTLWAACSGVVNDRDAAAMRERADAVVARFRDRDPDNVVPIRPSAA